MKPPFGKVRLYSQPKWMTKQTPDKVEVLDAHYTIYTWPCTKKKGMFLRAVVATLSQMGEPFFHWGRWGIGKEEKWYRQFAEALRRQQH